MRQVQELSRQGSAPGWPLKRTNDVCNIHPHSEMGARAGSVKSQCALADDCRGWPKMCHPVILISYSACPCLAISPCSWKTWGRQTRSCDPLNWEEIRVETDIQKELDPQLSNCLPFSDTLEMWFVSSVLAAMHTHSWHYLILGKKAKL